MNSKEPAEALPTFPECTAEHVFNEINSQAGTQEARSLWGRMQEEIKRPGCGGCRDVSEREFTRLKQEFTRELSTATSD